MSTSAPVSPSAPALASTDALPRTRLDLIPLLLAPALALIALPLVGAFPTWVTLTIAGLAMGMIIFIIASGPVSYTHLTLPTKRIV